MVGCDDEKSVVVIEEKKEENIFEGGGGLNAIAGAELTLNKEPYFPIATYEDTKRDAERAILNALANVGQDEGAAVQILFRPAQKNWSDSAKQYMENTQKGKTKTKSIGVGFGTIATEILRAPWEPPDVHEKKEETTTITSAKQDEITGVAGKIRYPGFETLIRVIASSASAPRSEAIMGGVVSAFAQFNSPQLNGFKVNAMKDPKKMAVDYTFRYFPVRMRSNILNSVELASIFHLPEQSAIPTSQVERQLTN